MAKFTPVISKELKETVRKNPNIEKVYFAENGQHYFNKHEIEVHSSDGKGNSTGITKVSALPGVKQEVLRVITPNKSIKAKKVNVDYTEIACEMDRDEILDTDEQEASAAKAPAAKGKKTPIEKAKEEDDNN